MSPSRRWCVVVDVNEDASLGASVRADDNPLLPGEVFVGPIQVMTYVEAALVDVRWGDQLEAVLRAPGTRDVVCSAASREVLLAWLGPTMLDLWQRQLTGGTAPQAKSKDSGTYRRLEISDATVDDAATRSSTGE